MVHSIGHSSLHEFKNLIVETLNNDLFNLIKESDQNF